MRRKRLIRFASKLWRGWGSNRRPFLKTVRSRREGVKGIPRSALFNALDAPEHDIDSQRFGHGSRTRDDTSKRLRPAPEPVMGRQLGFCWVDVDLDLEFK